MASNASLFILKNIHKLWGSQRTVDNSVKNAWNSPNFGHFHIRGGTQQDLYAGFLLIRLLLIAPRILIMHKASAIPSSSVRTIWLWRERDLY